MNKNIKIILDIETTGLHLKKGDRIIEIGCLKIIDNIISNCIFHTYIYSGKIINKSAYDIHGISNLFLKNKPKFNMIINSLLFFIKNYKLIIHNANFDIGFLNNELLLIGKKTISYSRIIDTLVISKKRFPGSKVNLNALCKKFQINLNSRKKHGALIDIKLLSLVYFKLLKKKQIILLINNNEKYYTIKEYKKLLFNYFTSISKKEINVSKKLVDKLNIKI